MACFGRSPVVIRARRPNALVRSALTRDQVPDHRACVEITAESHRVNWRLVRWLVAGIAVATEIAAFALWRRSAHEH